MELYMNQNNIENYLNNQAESIQKMIDNLDINWPHYIAVKKLLEESMVEINKHNVNSDIILPTLKHERKIEKYTNWVEVYRLANYHFSKYTGVNTSYSEGLFSTLLALNNMYIHDMNIKDIGIIGCGPGRSVLDFSCAYPNATIYGLDYSLVSLVLAKNIVSSNKKNIEIIRRDDKIIIDKINGFNRNNCKWGMFDLVKSNLKEKFDIVVCSNVINLMPNHSETIKKIYDMIKPNGYLIYADLTGWRLDRKKEQQLLCDRKTIKNSFEMIGFNTIECFDGGPYIEKENKDNFTFYKQTYYIGKKENKMKNIILLSGPDKTKYFSNEISKEIKKNIDYPTNMVVIPADPNNYKKNDKQFNGNDSVVGVFKTFKKIFPDLNIMLLDNRTDQKDGINKLNKADIIYLLGGNPFIQLEYLKKNNYSDIIRNNNALVIGVSAGAMNLAIDSYYSKDEDYPQSIIYKGLGIVDITIDPHFDVNNEEQVNEIKLNSKEKKIIGLPNDSAIIISNNDIKYIGNIYLFENGVLSD